MEAEQEAVAADEAEAADEEAAAAGFMRCLDVLVTISDCGVRASIEATAASASDLLQEISPPPPHVVVVVAERGVGVWLRSSCFSSCKVGGGMSGGG